MRNIIKKILRESEWFNELPLDEGGIDETVMSYLKTNYPKKYSDIGYYIVVDEKPIFLNFNVKKYMLNKIYWEIVGDFSEIGRAHVWTPVTL